MNYPTIQEVEKADRLQLARWYRFLPSPGSGATGATRIVFDQAFQSEKKVMDRIMERFRDVGEMSKGISKQIGWE